MDVIRKVIDHDSNSNRLDAYDLGLTATRMGSADRGDSILAVSVWV